MKSDRKYYILLAIAFIVFVVVEYNAPKPVNWIPSYSKKDKIPYGGYVIYDFLTDLFPGKNITEAKLAAYNFLDDEDSGTNYIVVNNAFNPDTLDSRTIRNYVEVGNNVFIAAEDFNGALADSLKIKTAEDFFFMNNSKDSISLNFTEKEFHAAKDYKYRKGTVDYYFTNYDTAHTTILGKNSLGKPNYIRITYGGGAFYLSTVPLAFTNYNALKGENSEYISRALSYLPVADTRWDEFYKPNNHEEADTPLRFILNNDSLKRAYFIMMFGLLLYILFEGKRKQRIIPVIKPMENTSLEFVETIGMLYYQKGTNAGIAFKKIQFFHDHLRNVYNIKTISTGEDFYKTVSRKTGVEISEIRNLFTFINSVGKMGTVDEATLISLNNMIEDFYQKTK